MVFNASDTIWEKRKTDNFKLNDEIYSVENLDWH